MDDEKITERLRRIVNDADQDVSIEEARAAYEEELAEHREHATELVDEEDLQEQALSVLEADLFRGESTGGPVEELEILTIGHKGVQQWSDGDGGTRNVIVSFGLTQPEDEPMGVGVFINDESRGADLGNVRELFGETLTTAKGWYQVEQSDTLSNVYICNTTDETRVEYDESVDRSRKELLDLLRTHIDEEADLSDLSNVVTTTNDEGYAADFGADIKRLEGTVISHYQDQQKGYQRYTVKDRSTSVDDLDDAIHSEQARDMGLTVWLSEDFYRWGEDSTLEFYGTFERDDEGQIQMNAYGIVPLNPRPLEQGEESSQPTGLTEESI